MNRLISTLITLSLLLVGAAFSQSSPASPDRYAVILPSPMLKDTAKTAVTGVFELGIKAKPGSEIEIFDGGSLRSIGTLVAPKGNDNRRKREVSKSKAFRAVQAFAKRSLSKKGDSVAVDSVRLPQALSLIARRGKPTRCLVFADPCYRYPVDAEFVFGSGSYPGDGFLSASPSLSVFGTKGLEAELKGLSVYFCHLNDQRESLYQQAVGRFWGLHIGLKGGVLAAFEPDGSETVRRSLAGESKPASVGWALDRTDTGFVMKSVNGPRVVRPVEDPVPVGTKLVIVQDGSGSSSTEIELVRRATWSIADKGSRTPAGLHLGVVLCALEADTVVLGLKPMKRDGLGSPEKDLRLAADFLLGKEGLNGERKDPAMKPITGIVDMALGLERALDQLETGPKKGLPLLVVVGDSGSLHAGVTAEARERALKRLGEFIKANPETRILSVLTTGFEGLVSEQDKACGAFFSSIAAAAGNNGTMANASSWIEPWTTKMVAEANEVTAEDSNIPEQK